MIDRDINFLSIIILFFINIILSHYNGFVDLWSLQFGNTFLYTICSVLGSLSIIYLFKKIKNSHILKYLGENSLVIMTTHQVLINNFINQFTGGEYTYFTGILVLIGIIIIEIPIIEIINRYFPFVLGNFKKKENIKATI